MDPEVAEKVKHVMERLRCSPDADPLVVDALTKWILDSTFLSRLRMNANAISLSLGLSVDTIASHCLIAAHMGIFDLFWTSHCHHCNMISQECVGLRQLPAMTFCSMCEDKTAADFRNTVEVTFALPQEVEPTRINPGCCAPKVLRPKFQMVATKGEHNESTDTLDAGVYRFYCPLTLAKGKLVVEGEPFPPSKPSPFRDSPQLLEIRQLKGPYFDCSKLSCRPGPVTIRLFNDGEFDLSGLNVHLDRLKDVCLTPEELDAPRLSGLYVVHLAMFQKLFGSEVLSRQSPLAVCNMTVLFMDVTDSTFLYERQGDMRAFIAVQRVFEVSATAVERRGGRVVKTIGDSIMASFVRAEQGLQAAGDMLRGCAELKAQREAEGHEGIEIKVGLHCGPTVMSTCNGISDFFGATVNRACRVESLCPSMHAAVTEPVLEAGRCEVEAAGWTVDEASVELKGFTGQHRIFILAPAAPQSPPASSAPPRACEAPAAPAPLRLPASAPPPLPASAPPSKQTRQLVRRRLSASELPAPPHTPSPPARPQALCDADLPPQSDLCLPIPASLLLA